MKYLVFLWFISLTISTAANFLSAARIFRFQSRFGLYIAMYCVASFGESSCALLNTLIGVQLHITPVRFVLPSIGRTIQATAAVMLALYLYGITNGNRAPKLDEQENSYKSRQNP